MRFSISPAPAAAAPIRRLRAAVAAGAAVTSLALVAAACSGAGGDKSVVVAEAGPPRPGGTLTFALAADPTCLDPQQFGANASLNVGRQLVDSLTDQDGRTGEIKPWLATSWEVNPQATSFTFHLRPGVTFSDGSPLDGAAVKANLDGIVALGAKATIASSYLTGYIGTTVLEPGTVRVDFGAPSAQFLQATSTMSLGLLSSATIAKTPEQRCQGDLVGSGPFTVRSYKPNQGVELAKRSGYTWGSSLFAHPGEAYLDKLVFKIVPESGVRAGSLESAQVDGISDVQPQDEARFESGYTVLTRPNPGVVFGLQANVARPILAEEAVRRAIQKAVDRPELAQTVLTPKYKAATSVLASVTPGWVDLSAGLGHDPEGAERLLEEAGWKPGRDGIRVKDGRRLSVDVIFAPLFNASQSVLELVQQELRKVGVELKLRKLATGEQQQVQAAGDYDFAYYNVTRSDADILRTLFGTRTGNRLNVAAGELDNVLDDQAQNLDPALRAARIGDAQRIVVDRAYVVPLFELSQVHALGARVHGLTFEASSRLQFHDTWVSS
ncbi:ABC transporter substrate-binding protein [Streptomyces sp. SID3343]|uniref:ABC transporter substrate-binding protein n=1 Tax=Streptomyces sp. SID3343 TaxID=2690260 RepID=UPI001369BA95|nr:ABC transporter substrate-binding protein [Streptomyces sp. SID3343]MYW06057.1 ABC transporter substrate-binding protein [Streptomyces sp. SID3343]